MHLVVLPTMMLFKRLIGLYKRDGELKRSFLFICPTVAVRPEVLNADQIQMARIG